MKIVLDKYQLQGCTTRVDGSGNYQVSLVPETKKLNLVEVRFTLSSRHIPYKGVESIYKVVAGKYSDKRAKKLVEAEGQYRNDGFDYKLVDWRYVLKDLAAYNLAYLTLTGGEFFESESTVTLEGPRAKSKNSKHKTQE